MAYSWAQLSVGGLEIKVSLYDLHLQLDDPFLCIQNLARGHVLSWWLDWSDVYDVPLQQKVWF